MKDDAHFVIMDLMVYAAFALLFLVELANWLVNARMARKRRVRIASYDDETRSGECNYNNN